MDTVERLKPQLRAIRRALNPNSHFWRKTSLICRMDDLDLGICPPPLLEKRQGAQSVIRAVATQGGCFASESVATFPWNRWLLSFGTGGYFRLEQVATLLWNTQHIVDNAEILDKFFYESREKRARAGVIVCQLFEGVEEHMNPPVPL